MGTSTSQPSPDTPSWRIARQVLGREAAPLARQSEEIWKAATADRGGRLSEELASPILAAALTFGFYIAGHFNADLKNFEKVVNSRPAALLARGVYHVLPDLSAFDVKTEVVHGLPVTTGYLVTTTAYGLAYVAALLLVATFIFSRRDFK